jgi:hypothetical protein
MNASKNRPLALALDHTGAKGYKLEARKILAVTRAVPGILEDHTMKAKTAELSSRDTLDNRTITKLAIAIANAIKEQDEVIGPLARKVLDTLNDLDSLPHFVNPRER